MHGAEVLIPLTMFAGGFAMIFGIYYLRTRQNMAMIEKGMNPKQFANRPAPYRNLKWGLLLTGCGIGLTAAYLATMNMHNDEDRHEALFFAFVAIGGGLGLITSYFIEKKETLNKKED